MSDLDNDGSLDFVVGTYNTHQYTVWRGQGNGSFVLAETHPFSNAYRLALADFSGDGMIDLLTAAAYSGVASVWVNRGAVTQTLVELSTPTVAKLDEPFNVVVSARGANGSIDTSFTGTVVFKSSDKQAVLPSSYTFTAADHGVKTFTITPGTLGKQTYSAVLAGASQVVDGEVVEVSSRPLGFSDTLPANPGGYGQGAMTTPSDFDGDGLLDMAVVDSSQNTLRIYLGQGVVNLRSRPSTQLKGLILGPLRARI